MAIVLPNPPAGSGLPVVPPLRADGRYYRFEMIYDGGAARAYADDPTDLLGLLVDAYESLAPVDRLARRIRLAMDVAVRAQARILTDPDVRSQSLTDEEEHQLTRSRAAPPNPVVWRSTIPLVLVTTNYHPFTAIPRPSGLTATDGRVDANIIWIDPIEEYALLLSLDRAGEISLASSDSSVDGALSASFQPYDPETETGIQWSPGSVRLVDRGVEVAVADQSCTTAREFWATLGFLEAFPQVTHWYGAGTPWTGTYRLDIAPETTLEADEVIRGTIRFLADEEADAFPWMVDTTQTPWLVTVSLPPFEPAGNLTLRMILAQRIVNLIGGDIAPGTWRFASAIVPSADVAAAFPTSWQGWRLAEGASPRDALVAALGI